ncbi:nitroreductase family protein [uncultured Bacteroides sp.]|uniref:nitroreductase family protein n=1 Tax=uncultured Bacteroides sp. TaxID=162156 RepID=UPI002AAB4812|nr:nitroreductase family protein [uncultured Bacteroides sp.]
MNFLELSKQRYSARNYSSNMIEQEKLDYILECARFAPSAVNYQPWHFFIVKSDEQKLLVQQSYPREWFTEAPLYIVVCADSSISWVRKSDHKNHSDIDAAIATEHICLAATEQGLGSCWVCNFNSDMLKNNLHLAANMYPVAIISLGYVKQAPEKPSQRKAITEIVSTL